MKLGSTYLFFVRVCVCTFTLFSFHLRTTVSTVMTDLAKDLKAEATGSGLTVDQLAEIIGGMSQTDKTSLLGKLQGATPKITGTPEVHGQVEHRAPALAERRELGDHKLPKLPKFSGSSGKSEPSFRV